MNIVREMERLWGIKARGGTRLILDGQVSLDDRVLTMDDERLPVDECRGRMLTAGHRQARLLGGRAWEPKGVLEHVVANRTYAAKAEDFARDLERLVGSQLKLGE